MTLLRWLQVRRFQPFVNMGGDIGWAGLPQKVLPFRPRGQLLCPFPCLSSFFDEPFAKRSILFEPVAFHLNILPHTNSNGISTVQSGNITSGALF